MFYLNLALFGILGVGTLYWFGIYTDLLPAIGGILGLGGAFAWVTFISKLVEEERLTKIRVALDQGVFPSKRSTVGLLLTGLVLCFLASSLGTLEIREPDGNRSRRVWLLDDPGEAVSVDRETAWLSSGKPLRVLRWVGFFDRDDVYLKIEGLPLRADPVRLRGWARHRVLVPGDIRSSAVLFATDAETHATLENLLNNGQIPCLDIRRERRTASGTEIKGSTRVVEYVGQSLWIGCGADVEIPDAARQRLVSGREGLKAPNAFALFPEIPPEAAGWILTPGEELVFEIRMRGADPVKPPLRSLSTTVRAPTASSFFPNILTLNWQP